MNNLKIQDEAIDLVRDSIAEATGTKLISRLFKLSYQFIRLFTRTKY